MPANDIPHSVTIGPREKPVTTITYRPAAYAEGARAALQALGYNIETIVEYEYHADGSTWSFRAEAPLGKGCFSPDSVIYVSIKPHRL